jgi:hypothetical protein
MLPVTGARLRNLTHRPDKYGRLFSLRKVVPAPTERPQNEASKKVIPFQGGNYVHIPQPTLETRIIGALVVLVLLLAFVALYIYPEYTSVDFAWTIKPNTTAILIGEGYLAGALFFVRVVMGSRWQSVGAGVLPITSFTIVMMAATLLH